ncbi:MAG: FliM/FliN family flagellar motor switch protein [Terriglobales bacterium]
MTDEAPKIPGSEPAGESGPAPRPGVYPKLSPDLEPWFVAWQSRTQNVLAQILGKPQSFELSSQHIDAADSDLRFTVTAAGAVQGEMALRLPAASAVRLARQFLGEAPVPVEPASADSSAPAAPISNEDKEALEELLRQITGLAATAVSAVCGGPVQLQLSAADAPWAATADAAATLRSRDEGGVETVIEIRISPALAAMLVAIRAAASASESPPEPAAPPVPPAGAVGYQRLFDVGLGVKLRFGTRRMLLRDVLALSSGLVVELDNALDSPVDLLLDGRIIARGEVVVIDGKYGLRVTEVIDGPPVAARAV